MIDVRRNGCVAVERRLMLILPRDSPDRFPAALEAPVTGCRLDTGRRVRHGTPSVQRSALLVIGFCN